MPKLLHRIVLVVLAFVVLRAFSSVIPYVRETLTLRNGEDLRGYYVAATLVREHRNLENYAEATWNVDPVVENADPNTVFAQTSKAIYGTTDIQIYDYPPLLADLVVPLTYLGPQRALEVWNLLNVLALALSVHFLAEILETHSLSFKTLTFVIALLFRPVMDCIYWAQVPIFLLLLLTAGFALYRKDRRWGAALLFTIAIAIKLTPLIVIIPLLAWRDWKTLRAIAACGAFIVALVALVNGWRTLALFFLDEVPNMSGKFLHLGNEGLSSAIQALFHGGQMAPTRPALMWASRAITLVILGLAYWLSRSWNSENKPWWCKTEVFAIFLLLSACLSPVSWLNAYVLSLPVLVIICIRVWRRQSSLVELGIFSMLIVSLSVAVITDLKMLTPLLGIALGLLRLHDLRENGGHSALENQLHPAPL